MVAVIGPVALLLHEVLLQDRRLLVLGRVVAAMSGSGAVWVRVGGGFAVAPLSVPALVVDEELGALEEAFLVGGAVDFLEEPGLEGDAVGGAELLVEDAFQEFLDRGSLS